MIIVNFDPGRTTVSKKGLWQYDYGQVLRITGLDLPKVVEVHFSFQEYDGDAEIVVGSTKDKITEVEIPKFALEGNGQLCGRIYYVFAFVYVENGETGRTKYKIRLDINARPKPKDYTEPEHEELFGQVIKEVNEAVERVEAAEGKAKEYADKTTEDAQNTAADRKEVERLVESVSDIDDKVEEIKGYRDQSLTAAGNALQSEQNAKTSEEMARDYTASAEASENAARTYAEQTEQAKAVVMELGKQVADDKTHVDKIAQEFTLTVQQATADINNTGQEQAERVQTAGDTAVDDINTTKDTALNQITDEGEKQVTAIETSGSQQTGIVTAEGEKQVEAIQQAASEIIADREQIRTNTENIAQLDDEVDLLAPAIIQTANGEFVQIKDSAEKKIAGLKIFGKSEQNTTQGYQLLPVPLGKEIVSLDKEVNAIVEEDGIVLTYNYNSLTTSSDIYFAGDNNATIETGYEECMQAGTYNVHFEQESMELLFYVVVWKNGSSSVLLNLSKQVNDATLTVNEGDKFRVFIRPATRNLNKNAKAKAIISKESQTVFEPYTGGKPSPSPDYPQEIVSAELTDINVNGANLFDANAVKKNTWINTETGKLEQTKLYWTSNYILIKSGQQYSLTTNRGSTRTAFYDSKKTPIRYVDFNGGVITPKEGEVYIAFTGLGGKEQNLMFNEGAELMQYEPYKEQAVAFSQTITLRGIGDVKDTIECVDGVYGINRKNKYLRITPEMDCAFQITDVNNNCNITYATVSGTEINRVISDKFIFKDVVWDNELNGVPKIYAWRTQLAISFPPNTFANLEEYKSWLSNIGYIDLVYCLSEPTFEPLPQADQDAIKALHSYYHNTTVQSNAGDVQSEMEVSYVTDTKTYIDNKFAELNSALANTQAQLL